ncbi:MerR family transcriptional regulator [Pelosinus propionicus]|uniref:DNA binding domain-containing protein, excisionase family n=1 Tax=Pelosinus propionicus DSM 13327 TaxID=1123291 RepID=A0A1I4HQZ5_9FIRM|nr:DNA-binding protein [Pelosinus propionicus]SFL43981.1 DNA binding domain-containing protein, excisionase family [Pelosinus propionicus DSM 13327]
MMNSRNFLDLEEVRMEVFSGKISRAYCYVLVKQGKIKAIRVGRKILIPVNEAARLLAEGVN